LTLPTCPSFGRINRFYASRKGNRVEQTDVGLCHRPGSVVKRGGVTELSIVRTGGHGRRSP
jgi:hypothetical protein